MNSWFEKKLSGNNSTKIVMGNVRELIRDLDVFMVAAFLNYINDVMNNVQNKYKLGGNLTNIAIYLRTGEYLF